MKNATSAGLSANSLHTKVLFYVSGRETVNEITITGGLTFSVFNFDSSNL